MSTLARALRTLNRRVRLLSDWVCGDGRDNFTVSFLSRQELRLLLARSDKKTLAGRFCQSYTVARQGIMLQADLICAHKFKVLGEQPGEIVGTTGWRHDFGSGRSWRRVPSPILAVQLNDGRSDIKRVWELSRCQHFATLGQAYLLSENERCPREWVVQMLDWDEQNPPLIGPNWISPMEAAIRVVNWIWGYAFMGDSPAFGGQARIVFYRNLLSHGRFIMRHVEPYGNHRLSNFVGLLWLGVLFPEFKEAREWRMVGMKGFCEEIERQVRSDGVHFEGSIPYHRLVLEMAATTWLLLQRNGIELPADVRATIARMFYFTAACLQPNGFTPQVGDADDGRLQEFLPLDKRDHSYLLSLAAVLTGRSEFKTTEKPHPEAFWLLGEQGLREYESLPMAPDRCSSRTRYAASDASICGSRTSVAFPESGFYVFRSDRLHALVSCRRPHPMDIGAHIHNDHLSFTLTLDGVEFIVDSGTYTYTGSLRARDQFRSTGAHNTVMVDGQEINPLPRNDPFRLKDKANCRVIEWRTSDDEDVLTATHEGYARLGVRVQRTFRHDRRTAALRVIDSFFGSGAHELTWRFHFAPEVKMELACGDVLATRDGRSLCFSLPVIPGMRFLVSPTWYSPSYGVKHRTNVLVISVTADLPISVGFDFLTGGGCKERRGPQSENETGGESTKPPSVAEAGEG